MSTLLLSPQNPRVRRAVTGALAALSLLLVSGCTGAVEIEAPAIDAADVAACEALVADLPDELFGQERRKISGPETTSAAWGDPPVVLQCGARVPTEFDPFSRCSEIDGVGWFMPNDALKDDAKPITITAQSHSPRMSITVPSEHRQNAPDMQIKILGELVAEHLTETQPCT